MTTYDAIVAEFVNAARRAVAAEDLPAISGRDNGNGTWSLRDADTGFNRIWVTMDQDRQIAIAFDNIGISREGVPLFVRRDRFGQLYIHRVNMTLADQRFGAGLATALQPIIIGELTPMVLPGSKLRPGRIRRSAEGALNITLEAHHYVNNLGNLTWFPDTDIDLAPYEPAPDFWRWIAVGIDPLTNGAHIVAGTQISRDEDLTMEDLLALTTQGYAWRGGIILRDGQINALERPSDYVDIRPHHGDILASSEEGALSVLDRVMVDSDGNVMTDADGNIILEDV